MPPITSGRLVLRVYGFIRSTAASPAAIETPEPA